MTSRYALAGFLSAAFAVVVQYFLSLSNAAAEGRSLPDETVHYASYMTVWTNTLVALCFCAAAFPALQKLDFFRNKSLLAATAGYITMVGLAYHILLSETNNPQGLEWFTDLLLHYINPVLYLVWWAWLAPKDILPFREALRWMIFPAVYFLFSLIKGFITDWYPYPFVNVTELGYPAVLTTSAVLMAIYLIIGLVFTVLCRRLAMRTA